MRKILFNPSILGNGLLWLVGAAMQIGGWVNPVIAYALLGLALVWSLSSLFYWRKRGRVKEHVALKQKALPIIDYTKLDSVTMQDRKYSQWVLK